MPKINIYESDLTTAGGLNASSNVVYVPGFAKFIKTKYAAGGENEIKFPYQFNSVAEFKNVFSKDDGTFEYIGFYNDTDKDKKIISVERTMVYALSILQAGLPIMFDMISQSGDAPKSFESEFEKSLISNLMGSKLDKITDRNNYDIKFITSGGYANYSDSDESKYGKSLGAKMLEIAATRADCTALLDHDEKNDNYDTLKDMFNSKGKSAPANGKYGAMFTPWCTFELPSQQIGYKMPKMNMPGSLAYLLAFGTSVKGNNANWLAAAGASRGVIPYIDKPLEMLTEAQIDNYALTTKNYIGVAINPIAQINPYGVIVWGNRTLHQGTNGLIASNFLNIRQLCNDIKKTIYVACKSITFEQNSDILWVKFKSLITPLLDQMLTGNGISGYNLKKKKSTKKATLTATIRVFPIEAVEDFEMTVELADEATNVIE